MSGMAWPLGREKAVEEQVETQGIHGRDVQQVGHERVGGRAAALAADALAAGKAHDVPDDQEIVRQVQLTDHCQLVLQQAPGSFARLGAYSAQTHCW
jgi:hypothetical protein